MPFIRFTERGRSFASKVSLSKSGTISFNDGARRRFMVDQFKYCVLFYDPDTLRVGIKLTNDETEEGARKLRLRSTGADVAAKSFTDFFQIEIEGTTIYELKKDEINNLLIFDLSSGKKRTSREKETQTDEQTQESTED